MPYFIKTGYWDLLSKAPKGYLDLNLVSGGVTDDIYSVVDGSSTFSINSGVTEILLPAGFAKRLRIFRNNVLLDFEDQGLGDPYFTYDATTGIVTLSVETSSQEKFVFMAY